jgi:hypothetical protein
MDSFCESMDLGVRTLRISIADSICRPFFKRFVSWIQFVRPKISNYSINFDSEGFVYESRKLTLYSVISSPAFLWGTPLILWSNYCIVKVIIAANLTTGKFWQIILTIWPFYYLLYWFCQPYFYWKS